MRQGAALGTLAGAIVLGLGVGMGGSWLGRPAGRPTIYDSPAPSPSATASGTPAAPATSRMVTGQGLVEAGWRDPIRITEAPARFGACLDQQVAVGLPGRAAQTTSVSLAGGKDASGSQVVLEAESVEKAQELGTVLYDSARNCKTNSAGRYTLSDQGKVDIDGGSGTWFELSGPGKSLALHAVVRVEKRVTLLWLEPVPSTSEDKLTTLEKHVADRLR